MDGIFLYRLNYEEYKKKEAEIDAKLMKLSEEDEEDEDIMPLDEAYIVRFDTEDNEDFDVQDSGYFVVLIGDYDYNTDYAEEVILSLDDSYARYKELKSLDKDKITDKEALSAVVDLMNLNDYFFIGEGEADEIIDEILAGEADYGEVIKQIF